MTTFNKEVFKGKTFSNILEEIYDNQRKKDKQINALINELKPMIEEIGDATLIVPLIKEYLEIGVKNDDLLVKMAALVQRTLNNTESSAQLGISDEEKEQLLNAVKNLK
jgi:esterase/lipase